MNVNGEVSLAQVIRQAIERGAASLRVMVPGRVTRWDPAKQQADVEPLLEETFRTRDGEVSQPLPVIPNVPVIFPGAGGFRLTLPLTVGDVVALVFCDRSLDLWLEQGGMVNPKDPRRHDLTDAVAIPGLHPWSAAWTNLDSGAMTIGKDAGPFQGVALGAALRAELNDIRTKFAAHTHAGVTTGGGTSGATATALAAAQTIESSTVKVST